MQKSCGKLLIGWKRSVNNGVRQETNGFIRGEKSPLFYFRAFLRRAKRIMVAHLQYQSDWQEIMMPKKFWIRHLRLKPG